MAYETLVAVYDSPAHADAAVKALKAAGFHESDISIFGADRLKAGQAALPAGVQENEVAHATAVLDIHRPVDVHDRAVTSGAAAAEHVETVQKKIAEVPLAAAQTVAVTPKLAEALPDVLRLAEEQLQVGKEKVETGRTRVRRFVTEKDVAADVTLHEEHAEVIRNAVTNPAFVGDIDWADEEIEV